MSKYTEQKRLDNIDKILNSSFSSLEKNDVLYAYNLSESIKTDEKLFRITHDKRLLLRVKSKKDILFALPDRLPVIFHHITGDNLVKKPLLRNDDLLNFYN